MALILLRAWYHKQITIWQQISNCYLSLPGKQLLPNWGLCSPVTATNDWICRLLNTDSRTISIFVMGKGLAAHICSGTLANPNKNDLKHLQSRSSWWLSVGTCHLELCIKGRYCITLLRLFAADRFQYLSLKREKMFSNKLAVERLSKISPSESQSLVYYLLKESILCKGKESQDSIKYFKT